jgi:cobalt-zinc-cadmium efflux system outer membrane protein
MLRFLTIALLCFASMAAAQGSGRETVRREIEIRAGKPVAEKASQPRRAFQLPPGLALQERVSADDAVAIALWNNRQLEADLAAIGLAQADLLDAGLLRNPNFQLLLPVGLKPFEFLLNWPVENLWQRKKRVLAAEKNLEVVSTGLIQNGLNVVRDVRAAHADLWLSQERAAALEENARLRARIAALTERRKEAGDASGLDVSVAWADAKSAAELAARAQGDIPVMRNRLLALLGMRNEARPLLASLEPSVATAIPSDSELAAWANASRPDLRAAELAIEAASYRARWQRSRMFDMVMPMLSTKETGTPLQNRAGPGLFMELPIFLRNQGQIKRADADVLQSAWRYAALQDRVQQEVREARARLEQARISLDQLRKEVRPVVEQAIAQTEAAYRNGDASLLNVLEAARQRYGAILQELDAQANMVKAYAELERSVGKRL